MGEAQAYARLLGYQVRANEEWKTAEQLFLGSLPGSVNIPNSPTPPSLTRPRWRQVSRFVRTIHSGLAGLQKCVQHQQGGRLPTSVTLRLVGELWPLTLQPRNMSNS